MFKYGLDDIAELKFESYKDIIEVRDEQWIDITLYPVLSTDSTPIPVDIEDFSIFVICND